MRLTGRFRSKSLPGRGNGSFGRARERAPTLGCRRKGEANAQSWCRRADSGDRRRGRALAPSLPSGFEGVQLQPKHELQRQQQCERQRVQLKQQLEQQLQPIEQFRLDQQLQRQLEQLQLQRQQGLIAGSRRYDRAAPAKRPWPSGAEA